MKPKKRPLAELQEVARVATQIALTSRAPLPDSVLANLVLGTRWDGDAVIFELYIPKARPGDAVVLTEARTNVYDGRVETVVVHDDAWLAAQLSAVTGD